MLLQEYDAAYEEIQKQMEIAGKLSRQKRESDDIETLPEPQQQRVDLRQLLRDQNGSEKTVDPNSKKKWTVFQFAFILLVQTVMIFGSMFMSIRNKLVMIVSSSLIYHILMQQVYKTHGSGTTTGKND